MEFKVELQLYIEKYYQEEKPMVMCSFAPEDDEVYKKAQITRARKREIPREAPKHKGRVFKGPMECSIIGTKKEKAMPDWLEETLKPTFHEKLFGLIDKMNLKDSDVYKASEIDRRLFSKIRSDVNYQPSKATVIQLCFGLKLEIDTALDLLNSAGYALSFSKKEDVIVRFFLEKKNYNLLELNTVLYDYDLKPLLS